MVSKFKRQQNSPETNCNMNEFHVSTAVKFLYCTLAGHVAIEVGEMSDGQEKGEENKQSGSPGWFLVLRS